MVEEKPTAGKAGDPSGKPEAAGAPPGPAAAEVMVGGDEIGNIPDLDSVDWGDIEGAEGEDGGQKDRAKRLLILGGGAAMCLLIVGTAAWFIIASSGGEGEGPATAQVAAPSGPVTKVEMALPRQGTTVNAAASSSGKERSGGLAPPAAGGAPAREGRPGVSNAAGPDGTVSQAALPGGESAASGEVEPGGVPMAVSPSSRPGSLNAIGAGAVAQQGSGIVVASVTPAAYAAMPEVAGQPLSQKPDASLQEQGPDGPLPKIDGTRQAWQLYARPFDNNEKRPRVAIIVAGLGLSPAATEAAIKRLPGGVTLAFDPYAVGAESWAAMARDAGHEILLMLPVEPETFPASDPGPQGLMTTLEPADNLRRLNFVLSRIPGYVGVVSSSGSRFNAIEGQIKPVLEVMKKRGLLFVDGGAAQQTVAPRVAEELGVPAAMANLVLDENPSAQGIDEQLGKLELLARQNTAAVGLALPYPSSLERLTAWIATLQDKNLALAPLSAVVDRQPKAGGRQARQ